jgi:hypothetical protein
MDTPRFEIDGNGEQVVAQGPENKGLPITLGGGNLAVLEGGIIRLYREDRELFSVDANSIPFEKKVLGAVVQVYLLGTSNGRQFELARTKQRLNSALALIFD